MAKQLIYDAEAREKLRAGVDKLANAVRICEAKFGMLIRYVDGAFVTQVMVGAPPVLVDAVIERVAPEDEAARRRERPGVDGGRDREPARLV